ncbi:MAG: hypothetical protein Q6364_06345 [Candidatus Hermodarchaeota archaeon]|nr:hypothetical protein [Candidatus Hermodarchaeota archaeon]
MNSILLLGPLYPLIFILLSVVFIIVIEVIRSLRTKKGSLLRLGIRIIGYWFSSYALFFILSLLTYRGGSSTFIQIQTVINTIISLSILGSIWYEMTAETRWKPLIPITLILMGILSAGYGFITLTLSPFSDPGGILIYIHTTTIIIGFGIILIIIGLLLQLYWWNFKS